MKKYDHKKIEENGPPNLRKLSRVTQNVKNLTCTLLTTHLVGSLIDNNCSISLGFFHSIPQCYKRVVFIVPDFNLRFQNLLMF